jgi:hypothetical protein
VSVKPSVMTLPPLDTQPIVMAGLGTGMAPFRAFIQVFIILFIFIFIAIKNIFVKNG